MKLRFRYPAWGYWLLPLCAALLFFVLVCDNAPLRAQEPPIFADGFESGNTAYWDPEIFADGFESGDLSRWSRFHPPPPVNWGLPENAGKALRDVCFQLTAKVAPGTQIGKPPLDICWDVGQDGVCDMFTEVRSSKAVEIMEQITVQWTPRDLGPVLVGFRVSNAYGPPARKSFLYDVRDPTHYGACCNPDGSCQDVVNAAQCPSGNLSLATYCSAVGCVPVPDPTWSALCLFGVCAWLDGEPTTFRSGSGAQGPWRYAWDTPASAAVCGPFGPWESEQLTHVLPLGAWRPCAIMHNSAGVLVGLRTVRTLLVYVP